MNHYDENLKMLREQVARKKHLQVLLEDLDVQQKELWHKAFELKEMLQNETKDVERLEGRSLAAFFYNVIGKKDEKLTKEREEAYKAAVKYDVAVRELEMVENDIQRFQKEMGELRGCEEQYENALQEKLTAIKYAGIPEMEKILRCEEKNSYLESQKKEIQEAIIVGRSALSVMSNISASLDSAESWGTYDALGGNLIAGMAKHQHLDKAQYQIEELQLLLRKFKTEMADVKIDVDIKVNIDGFTRFADHFFDGFFVDWVVLDEISHSKSQIENKREYLEQSLEKLSEIKEQIITEQEQVKEELGQLAVGIQL